MEYDAKNITTAEVEFFVLISTDIVWNLALSQTTTGPANIS